MQANVVPPCKKSMQKKLFLPRLFFLHIPLSIFINKKDLSRVIKNFFLDVTKALFPVACKENPNNRRRGNGKGGSPTVFLKEITLLCRILY